MPSQAKRNDKVLIVGLGNPGLKYEETRHNIGFKALDVFVDEWKDSPKHKSFVSKTSIEGVEVHLIKPQTFMNKSGEAVQSYAAYFKIPTEAIIVIHDEADLPFGEVKEKLGGGTAGHNGLKSIVERLGTQDFWRIRFGISHSPNENIPLDEYVLSKWTESEAGMLPELIDNTLHKLHELIVAPPENE